MTTQMHGRRTVLAVALLAGTLPAGQAAAAHYAGRRVVDVLEELRAAGLNLIYSTELVRPALKVREEPRAERDRQVLDEVLAPHGLVVRPGPGGTLVVVKAPRAAPARAPGGDALRLGFSDSADVAGALEARREGPGVMRVRPDDVLRTPGAVDNIFRALQVMPGITGAGLFETRIAVRGGAPDQNLTVMDGVEIHNPFRLFGAVAGFNPETIGRFELTAGAFPARYGDRLSSLLVVETRDGRRDVGLSGMASASATDASAVLEGRLPGPGQGSWLFAGRRTYYDLFAERILEDGLPTFNDVQLKLSWHGARGLGLALTGWRSREHTDADWSDPADKVLLGSRGANDLLAANYSLPLGDRLLLRGVASAYRFDETVDLDLQGYSDTRVSFSRPSPNAPADEDDQVLTLGMARAVGLEDVALRQEAAVALAPRHRLEAGAEVHWLRTRWRQVLAGDRSSEIANGSSALFGAGLPDSVDSVFDSTRSAVYLQYRGQLGDRLAVTPGLRWEHPGSGARPSLSPRLLAAIDLGRFRVKAGAGIHSQSPGYEKLIHSDYFLDLSESSRRGLQAERALHLVLGLERSLGDGLDAAVEGYYRDFSGLVVGRLETDAERAARAGQYDYPPALLWGVPSAPIITSFPVNGAEGRAYGVLATLSRDDRPGRRLSGWIAYAWGLADRTAYGRTYPFDYDRPHALTTVFGYRFSSKWELGVTARVASGLPTTPPRGVLILGAPDLLDRDGDGNLEELVPARDESGRLVYVADPGGAETLNSTRLPAYARVDARLSFRPRGASGRWLFYLEAINALNRENAASYDWDIRLEPGAARPRIEVSEGQDGLPLIPTLGVRWRF
jgi:hypothetical protein